MDTADVKRLRGGRHRGTAMCFRHTWEYKGVIKIVREDAGAQSTHCDGLWACPGPIFVDPARYWPSGPIPE